MNQAEKSYVFLLKARRALKLIHLCSLPTDATPGGTWNAGSGRAERRYFTKIHIASMKSADLDVDDAPNQKQETVSTSFIL